MAKPARHPSSVIRQPLSSYLRYAFEWVYTYSSEAGQDIRILNLNLNLKEHSAAAWLQRTGDFWVVEHQHVALVRYDDEGRHKGEVAVDDAAAAGYVAAAELAWQLGVPFNEWWAAHSQYRHKPPKREGQCLTGRVAVTPSHGSYENCAVPPGSGRWMQPSKPVSANP